MIGIIIAAVVSVLLTLVVVYVIGKCYQRHTGRFTGPNSRVPVTETAIPVIKKG